jgi:aerobic-type carbon monoxide dehydrogenase small subunit (CoxS/CutS family)
MKGIAVSTTVNGDAVEYVCHGRETLLDVLRDHLGLTGAKEGCGTGDCGACSVTLRDSGATKGTALSTARGRSSTPDLRGNTESLATKATNPDCSS